MSQLMKNIEDENRILQEKLSRLTEKEKIMAKDWRAKLKPLCYKDLHKCTGNFNNINSQIDYDLIMQKKKKKEEDLKVDKEKMELKGCTFMPEVNEKSVTYIKQQNYVPVYKRKLPEKKEITPRKLKEEEEFDRIQEEIQKSKPKRKLNPDFFEKQQNWEKQKKVKAEKERFNKILNECNVRLFNRSSKKRHNHTQNIEADFLKRMERYTEQAKIKKKQLDEKYNSCTFRPHTNKNDQIQSILFKETLYGSRDMNNKVKG